MKITIEFSDEKIEQLAMDMHEDLVKWSKCCNGVDCGCNGNLEADTSESIEQLQTDIVMEQSYFIELMQEYEKHYKVLNVE